MRVVLLGAGHIGQTTAGLLSRAGDFVVKVADQSEAALSQLAGLPLNTALVDSEDGEALRHALVGHDAVINALPYHLATLVAGQASAVGCHYFDLTEDVTATRDIQRIAQGAAPAFMPP